MADLSAAMREALTFAAPDDVICVTGSLHLVAEAERLLEFRVPSDEWRVQ
jgi:hypothetical protein